MHAKYTQLLRGILDNGVSEVNRRTGEEIRMLPHGAAFVVDNRAGRVPLPGNRRVFPKTAAAEVAWFLSGDKDIGLLQELGAGKIWEKFATKSDDFGGAVTHDAYGYRWRRHFERDQIALAVEALKKDGTDRRVYVSAWDPGLDGLGAQGQKSVPCPVGFHLSVAPVGFSDDPTDLRPALNMTLIIRSSDTFVGLPYDVMGFSLLQNALARSIGVQPGFMFTCIAHPHLYGKHFEMARESLRLPIKGRKPEVPDFDVQMIVDHPQDYVQRMKQLDDAAAPHHEFNPKPELIV